MKPKSIAFVGYALNTGYAMQCLSFTIDLRYLPSNASLNDRHVRHVWK